MFYFLAISKSKCSTAQYSRYLYLESLETQKKTPPPERPRMTDAKGMLGLGSRSTAYNQPLNTSVLLQQGNN